jgi:hypothetical protein
VVAGFGLRLVGLQAGIGLATLGSWLRTITYRVVDHVPGKHFRRNRDVCERMGCLVGGKPCFIHMAASAAAIKIGRRSWTSSSPPSAAAVTIMTPFAVFESSLPPPSKAAKWSGACSARWICHGCFAFLAGPLVTLWSSSRLNTFRDWRNLAQTA